MKLRILYYNTAFGSCHGGSTHARKFLEKAELHPNVEKITVFPASYSGKDIADERARFSIDPRRLVERNRFRQVLLPLRVLHNNHRHIKSVAHQLNQHKYNVLLVRTDSNFLQIPIFRHMFPDITIAVEINSSPFDEQFDYAKPAWIYRWLEGISYRHSDISFFVSQHLQSIVNSFYTAKNTQVVVQNGVDIEQFNPQIGIREAKKLLDISPDSPVIGYIGGSEEYRKLPVLIEAFAIVRESYPLARLLLVGGGSNMPNVHHKISELHLQESVSLVGRVEHHKVPVILESFDVAVHHAAKPYMSPLKLFEYLAMKRPVVAPDIPGVREIFEDEVHLLLTKPQPKEIADKICLFLANPSQAERMAEEGYKLVSQKYTWEQNANTIINRLLQSYQDKLLAVKG